jgi:hypothetical protein
VHFGQITGYNRGGTHNFGKKTKEKLRKIYTLVSQESDYILPHAFLQIFISITYGRPHYIRHGILMLRNIKYISTLHCHICIKACTFLFVSSQPSFFSFVLHVIETLFEVIENYLLFAVFGAWDILLNKKTI